MHKIVTPDQAREIRQRYAALKRYPTGHALCGSVGKIAADMKLPLHVINAIVSGRTYRNDSPTRRPVEAMDLMLKLLHSHKAEFSQGGTILFFNGIGYDARDGDWSRILDVIGWDVARGALAKGNGI